MSISPREWRIGLKKLKVKNPGVDIIYSHGKWRSGRRWRTMAALCMDEKGAESPRFFRHRGIDPTARSRKRSPSPSNLSALTNTRTTPFHAHLRRILLVIKTNWPLVSRRRPRAFSFEEQPPGCLIDTRLTLYSCSRELKVFGEERR